MGGLRGRWVRDPSLWTEGPSDNRLNRSHFQYPQARNNTCDCVQPLFRRG
jgi:hypothetical protein